MHIPEFSAIAFSDPYPRPMPFSAEEANMNDVPFDQNHSHSPAAVSIILLCRGLLVC